MSGHGAAFGAMATWRDRLAALRAVLARFPLALLQLMFRLSIGDVFWSSGMTKIASWQTTIVLFRDEYKVPLLPPVLAAELAAAVELSCPVLLVLGLGARLATLPMLAMTFVIGLFVYPEDWIEHLGWAAMLLLILTRGPGALSLDHLLARKILGLNAR
ncbi:MAG: DoxX family protein [Alphaproteobacteria bacterium]